MSGSTDAREAAERRDAARALLRSPFVSRTDSEMLTVVRRHAPALTSMFMTLLGYRLVTEAGFARLLKQPLSADAPPRPARRPTARGGEFSPTTYAYLSLLCAALLARVSTFG